MLETLGRTYFVHRNYDGEADGAPLPQIREIEWADGWPHFPGNT